MRGNSEWSPQLQGLVRDDIEQLRHQIDSAGIVHDCAVERAEKGTYFIVTFEEPRIPHGFFESYGLEFKEAKTVWSKKFWKFMLLGERWIRAVGVPKNDTLGGDHEHRDGDR